MGGERSWSFVSRDILVVRDSGGDRLLMLSNLWYIHACSIYILPFSLCVMQFYLPLPAVYASRSKFSNNSSINLVSDL